MSRQFGVGVLALLLTFNLTGCAGLWTSGGEVAYKGRFKPSAEVLEAIGTASRKTDVPHEYLLATAALESGFRPDAKAATSTAAGLYQFIEQTWLATLKAHGARHGLAEVAAAIQRDRGGRAYVARADIRRRIVDLRLDPYLSALMAAELACENAAVLRRALGRQPGPTELYLAHVLGAAGAASFLGRMQAMPQLAASQLFPKAARANPALFYHSRPKRPRSLDQLYIVFDTKMQAST
jgi:Transglycosylase SLT domain